MTADRFLLCLLMPVLAAAGCAREAEAPLLGTLEWDRVGVAAESSEPIVRVAAVEGADVKAGDVLLELDARRASAALEAAEADVRRAESALAELRRGSRIEPIEAARATLAGAQSNAANAKRERDRIAEIRRRGLVAQADLDRAETSFRTATAQADSARASLAELLHGTRVEDLDQAEAALAAAQARARELAVARERATVRAPVDGRVDSLPFKLGDQPPLGADVASVLSGPAPYARVYVPASRRARIAIGTRCTIAIEHVADTYTATVRRLRSDPAFTPYYALTGDDASRLAYRAELVLDGDAAKSLPAGLPARATCDGR